MVVLYSSPAAYSDRGSLVLPSWKFLREGSRWSWCTWICITRQLKAKGWHLVLLNARDLHHRNSFYKFLHVRSDLQLLIAMCMLFIVADYCCRRFNHISWRFVAASSQLLKKNNNYRRAAASNSLSLVTSYPHKLQKIIQRTYLPWPPSALPTYLPPKYLLTFPSF
jgi:hypothetical protein